MRIHPLTVASGVSKYSIPSLITTTLIQFVAENGMLNILNFHFYILYYRAMLCIRGTSHGPVSVRLSVRHKSVFY